MLKDVEALESLFSDSKIDFTVNLQGYKRIKEGVFND